jgi:hypothetical protein
MEQSIEAFRAFFESEIQPKLQPLEDYRLQRIKIYKRYRYFVFLAAVVLILSFFSHNALIISGCVVLVIIAIGFTFESLSYTNLYLRKEYKNKILPEILTYLFSDFEYIPRQKIAKSVFEKSLLFPHEVLEVHGEDFMQFRIDNVNLMFCEATVYGYPPKPIMFKGIFITVAFTKSFTAKTFIFPEKSTTFFRKLKFKILGRSYIVTLEDPEFEKEFIVLSEDQIESRYILTPSLMERILEYKKKLNIELAFSFIENKLYCSIPNTANLFEPTLFESFFDFNFMLKSYDPLILYTGIVKDLKLNMRIWSKR